MTSIESLYNLFGVQPTCLDEELRKAYRQLISNVHPDRNPGKIAEATAKTQELTASYQELRHLRSIQGANSDNANNDGNRTDQFGFEFGGMQFGFVFPNILDGIIKRKTEFQNSWQKFRDNPSDPICALLFIYASFEAERHDYVKDLLINPILTDLAALLLSRVDRWRACETLIRWANFLGHAGRGREAVQILEDAFATGRTSSETGWSPIKEELRSRHYRWAQHTDPTTGVKATSEVRIAHLSRILELGFTFDYIYKLLAEAHYDLGDDEQARGYLNKAYELNPNLSGAVRISRALGISQAGKSTRRQRIPLDRPKVETARADSFANSDTRVDREGKLGRYPCLLKPK